MPRLTDRLSKVVTAFVVTIFMVSATAISAGTITGKILDNSSGKSLNGATVAMGLSKGRGQSFEAMTSKDGTYSIENVPSGTYTIIISYVGFSTKISKDVVVGESDEVVIDGSLIPSAVNLDAISVTASRRTEKIVEAPASVAVVTSAAIKERSTLTPTDHIKGLAGVDVSSTGLNQSNAVARGFNNIFSGAMLVMTDNRIARVPSLRFNAHNFISTPNEDIERIEVVLGPGSALYGPNSSDGVMHIVTKSPFTSQGTSITLGGGEREIGMTSFRHAGLATDEIGYKFTGQYYRGVDWNHAESKETITRNFDIEKIAFEGRFDFKLGDEGMLIFNGGYNKSNGIELTGLGAGQVIDWLYTFGQARLTYKDLFAQVFINKSDAGETFLLNTGIPIVDKSKLIVTQIQHSYQMNEKQRFTYGVDGIFTRPATENTINGRNEDDDSIDELGIYVQSDTKLTDKLRLVGAARIDDNSRLNDAVFSPRAALVYAPQPHHNFRMTYNRAFSTPDNNNLFLDLVSLHDVGGLGAQFSPFLPIDPSLDVRVQGVPADGFHWNMVGGGPQFASPYAPLLGADPTTFYDFNDITIQTAFFGFGSALVLAGVTAELAANPMVDDPTAAFVVDAIDNALPLAVIGVNNNLGMLNPNTGGFEPFSSTGLVDIDPIEPTITQTFEIGYKGVLNKDLAVSVDLYYSKKKDFIGPLTIESPNVFLDSASLHDFLEIQFDANMTGIDSITTAAVFDNPLAGGNGNGSAADELAAIFSGTPSQIPYGTASPDGTFDPQHLMVTYRNFGDIDYYGIDLGWSYHINQNWDIGGTASYISDNFWEKSDNQPHDINLNAPQHKVSFNLHYHNPRLGFDGAVRHRWVDAFEMDSPFFGNRVPAYNLIDLNLGYRLVDNARLSLTVQNVLDNKHIEFIGGAELGRLVIGKVTYEL